MKPALLSPSTPLEATDWAPPRFLSAALITLVLVCVLLGAASFYKALLPAAAPIQLASRSVDFLPGNDQHAGLEQLQEAFARDFAPFSPIDRTPDQALWIRLDLPEADALKYSTVTEFRLLRPKQVSAWLVASNNHNGLKSVDLGTSIRPSKGGFAITLPENSGSKTLYLAVYSDTIAIPKVFLWKESDYSTTELQFERLGGALLGILILFAGFCFVVSVINRDWTFLLFSGWLIASYRIAAFNGGWDLAWIGFAVPVEWSLVFSRVSLAAYAILTVYLYESLFPATVSRQPWNAIYAIQKVGFVTLAILAVWLSHSAFQKAFWALASIALSLNFAQALLAAVTQRSRIAYWYSMAWGFTVTGMLGEVLYASGYLSTPFLLNAQVGSIAGALVTGVALAEKIRLEREARLRAQAKTVSALAKYADNYNSMPVGLFSADTDGRLSVFNPAFCQIFGISASSSARGMPFIQSLIGTEGLQQLREAAQSSGGSDVEILVTREGREPLWLLARATSTAGSIEASIQDITSRKQAEGQLRKLVDHDVLTGLLNRRGLYAALEEAIRSVQSGGSCALAYIDFDRFKLINDLHGHGTGDALLQLAASRLSQAVRTRDIAARLADGFVIVLFDCPDQAVVGLSERFREVISDKPFEVDGKGINMTVSVGAVSIERSMTPVDAVAAADRACSEAKARGRNCVVRLTDSDAALRAHLDELKVVADLQQRTPTDRYFLEFQPIVALGSAMASLSYEVLIRMRGENGAVIPPGKFIGAAERNGLMAQIDRWVLRNTLEWLDDHPEHRERLSFATINISGASLNDTRFVDDAFAMIAEHPLAMPKLCFEITESVALHDLGSTRRFVDRVRMYGSKLALDDFGAGYTSFNYLKEIPADFIKIDGSFVRDINRNPANYAITRTIVELTHELGMRSIAEWAETPDTIASLIELGVDYGQGFGLVRPIAPDIVTAALSCGALVKDPQVLALLDDRGRYASAARSALVIPRKAG